jgi:hypothetical protein
VRDRPLVYNILLPQFGCMQCTLLYIYVVVISWCHHRLPSINCHPVVCVLVYRTTIITAPL